MGSSLKLFLVLCISMIGISLSANHIIGANIKYQCIDGDSYSVTLNVFRNCNELTPLPAQVIVGVSYNCSSYQGNIPLTLVGESEVSQLCDDDLPSSTCSLDDPIHAGVNMHVYQGIVTIDSDPGEYRISWTGSGFRSETTNLINAGNNQTLNIHATIYKEENLCNNSAVIANLMAPYFCLNQEVNFNFSASDPDQDSLVYSFTSAQQNSGFCAIDLPYESGFSGLQPIPGATINPQTGQISFTPTLLAGDYTIVVRIDEYRDDVMVGNSFIDVQFKVVSICSSSPPEGTSEGITGLTSGNAELISPTQIQMCSGQSFCFDYSFESSTADAILEISSNLSTLFPSATVTTSGTNPIVATVCYTAELGDHGGVLVLDVADDNCPVSGISSLGILVNINDAIYAGEDEFICFDDNVQLQVIGDTLISWIVLSGEPIIIGDNFSCFNCPNPIVSPNQTSAYLATGQNLLENCIISDTIVVTVGLDAEILSQSETCDQNDGFITIEPLIGSGDYSLTINDVPFAVEDYFELLNIDDGNFNVSILDNVSGCTLDTLIVLDPFSIPNADAGENATNCGLDYILQAIPSSGVGTWTSTDPDVSFVDINDPNTTVSAINFGEYVLTWTEDNGPTCNSSDNTTITFVDAPDIYAGDDVTFCGLGYELNATNDLDVGFWSIVDGVTFDDINDPNSEIMVSDEGTYILTWTEDNGFGCVVSDEVTITLIENPSPDAGSVDLLCSLDNNLSAFPSVGVGTWSGETNLTFSNVNDPNTNITSTIEGLFPATWTEINQSCQTSDEVVVSFIIQPDANAGNDSIVCGLSANLNAIPSDGTGTWSSFNPLVVFADINDPQSEVTVPSFGLHVFNWTEDNGAGCIDSDAVNFTFLSSPIANAGAGDSVCGLNPIQLGATLTTGTGMWSFDSPNISISNINDPDATVSSTMFGDFELVWTEMSFSCSTQDEITVSFFEQPVAFAGVDFNVCGPSTNLTAISSVPISGNGLWTGEGSEFIDFPADPNSNIEVDDFDQYTLIWTETNGICSDVDSVTINFLLSNPPFAGPDDTTCDLTYSLNATPLPGGFWIANSLPPGALDPADINNPNAVITFSGATDESYNLSWFDPTCGQADDVTIFYLQTPNTFAGTDIITCGLEITMSPADNSWASTWILPPGISSPDPNISNAEIIAGSAGSYDLILQQSNGECMDADTVTVEFIAYPMPDVGLDDFECGLSTTLSVTTDGINGQWDSSGPLTYLPSNTSSVTNVTAGDFGTQDIYWTETDPTGMCVGSDTLTVVFNNAPDTTNFEITCVNLNTQYLVSFDIIGGEAASINVIGNGELSGNTYISDILNTHDTYTFEIDDAYSCDPLILSETFSCPSSTDAGTLVLDTIFACTNELITAEVDLPVFLDANDISLFVIHTNSDTLIGNILDSNYVNSEFIFNANYNLGQLYYLSSVVGDSLPNGNIDYSDPNLDVSYGIPIIFSTPPNLLIDTNIVNSCVDLNTQVQYTVNGIGPWDVAYNFLGSDELISDITNLENAIDIFDSGVLTYESISNQFCTTTLNDSVVINIFDNPTSSMPDLFQYCTNSEFLVDVELTGQGPWSIIFQDENLLTAPLDTLVFSNSISLPVDGEGYYWVANLFDLNCPSTMNIDSTFVELLETPVSLAGEDVALCFGDSVLLGEMNDSTLNYNWNNAQFLNNPTIQQPIANISIDTTAVVQYPFVLSTSNPDCSVLDTVIVTINPLPHDITVDPIEPFCSGQSIPLNVVGPYDFTWTPDEDLSDATINNPVTTASSDITYTLIAESTLGCIDSIPVIVDVLATPNVNIDASVNSGCLPLEVDVFNNTFITQGMSCSWTFSDDDTFISDSCDDIALILEENGDFNVSLRVIDPNGCVGEQSLDTLISVSEITSDFSFFPEEPRIEFDLIQFSDLSDQAISWTWTIDSVFTSSEPNPVELIEDLGPGNHEVCLEVLNEEGCLSLLCKDLEILDDPIIWVPNAFTPDNDNLNEVFQPIINGREQIETYNFSIYNRIGRRIFETTNMDDAWGRNLISERKRALATYVWVVEIKVKEIDKPIVYSGNVTILK